MKNLNCGWQLTYSPIEYNSLRYKQAIAREKKYFIDLPCDIHEPLLEAGEIKDPTLADYSYESEWTENQAWWFYKEFDLTKEDLSFTKNILTIEKIDAYAEIILNDQYVGYHESVHFPFTADVQPFLKEGKNTLAIKVTSGAERVLSEDLAEISLNINTEKEEDRGDRGDLRRAGLRKAQYVFGWDWGPRCATCGIMGDVTLKGIDQIEIKSTNIYTSSISEAAAKLQLRIEVDNIDPIKTINQDINIEIYFGKLLVYQFTDKKILLSGLNYIKKEIEIINPMLWWPINMGEQNLYELRVSVGNEKINPYLFGIRTTRLLTDYIETVDGVDQNYFAVEINGVKTFCKGGNLIPADVIYNRIDEAKYDILIDEAIEANFNMLRLWGGGVFEQDYFYEQCDKKGLMLWQDFMFGCCLIPEYNDNFVNLVKSELEYQTKKYGNHPSIVLWCGNNEIHTAYQCWWDGERTPTAFWGEKIFNYIMPEIVDKNTPGIPFWNSSPYGGNVAHSYDFGDLHCWGETVMNSDMSVRIDPYNYDTIKGKFISEYGYVGPCKKSTILKYHDGVEIDTESRIWQLHNNTFEKDTVKAGITKHYADADKLTLDEYLLYGGLTQGFMLGYSLESFRYMEHCSGGLFWMYNDCWGETGWTILDYYNTRKISYYFVKRAFEPVRFILREEDGIINAILANDTNQKISETIEYGYISYDGKEKVSQNQLITGEPFEYNSSIKIEKVEKNVIYFIKTSFGTFTMYNGDFRKIEKPAPEFDFKVIDESTIEITAITYCHAVHFNVDDDVKLSDCYFDLLPGEAKTVKLIGNSKTDIKVFAL